MRRSPCSPAFGVVLLALVMLGGCQRGAASSNGASTAPEVAPTMPATVTDPRATAQLRSFAGRDSNHDGVISRDEDAAAAAQIFHAIDVDEDGAMTAPELDRARAALGLTVLPGSQELIAESDQDNDGKLTLAEWIANARRDFDRADANHDQRLTAPEYAALDRLDPHEIENPEE